MKPLKQVEADRKASFESPNKSSIHRSSLLVPEIPDAQVEICFLNHFLLKHGIEAVACKITAIDDTGKKIDQNYYHVKERRAYCFKLSKIFNNANTYQVEFFSGENIRIPFPAVMVNHYSKNFINQVHAYNRVLNDVFENDSVNALHVKEASIDFRQDDKFESFFVFATGQYKVEGIVKSQIETDSHFENNEIEVKKPRFNSSIYKSSDIFPKLSKINGAIFKIFQPNQEMFYGRLFAGIRSKVDGSFSANHSYYDNSAVEEYWDNGEISYRAYPYIQEVENIVRMYPIMSPSSLALTLQLLTSDGEVIAKKEIGILESPSKRFLDINVNEVAKELGVDHGYIGSLRLEARGDKMPTRINHQLVYGFGQLESSINCSLLNKNRPMPPEGVAGFAWGQAIVGEEFESIVALQAEERTWGGGMLIDVEFFSTNGLLATRQWLLVPNGVIKFNLREELSEEIQSSNLSKDRDYIWFTCKSEYKGICPYVVTWNTRTKHCSGEHGFGF